MPAIIGTSHVDLTVTNLDRSVDFYRRALGLHQVFRGRADADGFEVAYLASPGSGLLLGLVQHDRPTGRLFDPRTVGLDHLSFAVSDRDALEQWANHLVAEGIANSGLSDQPPFGTGLNFTDPDGIALEFYHLLPLASS